MRAHLRRVGPVALGDSTRLAHSARLPAPVTQLASWSWRPAEAGEQSVLLRRISIHWCRWCVHLFQVQRVDPLDVGLKYLAD